MKRRTFVKNVSLASAGLPFVFNNFQIEAIAKELFPVPKAFEDRVLILIRLNGGNDGLNTIVPIDQYDNLFIQRSNIILPENQLISIANNNGMHPVMTGMANLFNNGQLSIVQNVGYPDQNRSHFRSMDIWTTGMMNPEITTGWLGRHFTVDHPDYPTGYPNLDFPDPFAISMGYEVSATCQGLISNFSHTVVDPFTASTLPNSSVTNDGSYYGNHMEFLAGVINQTNQYGTQISNAANAGNTMSSLYPASGGNPLADQLRQVAQMISGGLQTKIYILNVNGFDTHDNQTVETDTTLGAHADLMKQVSDAIYAFQDDLVLLGLEKRVLGMTFSEFGRQIASNASVGTDHGDAAPLFLFGDCINQQIYGPNPIIPDTVVNQAGLPMQIDFRDVYASVLLQWFGVEETTVNSLFEHSVTYHNIVGGCELDLDQATKSMNQTKVYPNPAGNLTTLKIDGNGEVTKIHLIDTKGSHVKDIFEGKLNVVTHHIPIDLSNLNPGIYRIVIQNESFSQSIQLFKE